MSIVKNYMHGDCRIMVLDDCYSQKSEEQQRNELEKAKELARKIVLLRGNHNVN